MLASRFALGRRVWLASAARAAKNRGVAHDVQSRNGKVPREIERKFLLKRLPPNLRDRKSTRLNSSHQIISYAVFCLKKKKETRVRNARQALPSRATVARLMHSTHSLAP